MAIELRLFRFQYYVLKNVQVGSLNSEVDLLYLGMMEL